MPLTSFVHSDPRADTLIVTNMWPVEDRPSYGIFVKRQVDSLIEAGLQCDVLLIHGYRSKLAYAAAALRIMRMRIGSRRYRLVHAHGGESIVAARLYCPGKVIVSYCGDDLLGTPRPGGHVPLGSRLRRSAMRAMARLASATITKSAEMERTLPSRVRARNEVIPNGVNVDLFSPIDRASARVQLDWPPHDRVALFAADPAVERKNIGLAREACEHARMQGLDVRLRVGNGIDPALMPTLLSASDCLLLTSTAEGSPNVVKEAMACNLPIVATDVGDVREQLADVTPSRVVAEGSPGQLAGALIDVLSKPSRSNGREAALARLDERLIAGRVLGLYDRMLEG